MKAEAALQRLHGGPWRHDLIEARVHARCRSRLRRLRTQRKKNGSIDDERGTADDETLHSDPQRLS